MNVDNVGVFGASGFIGTNLIEKLVAADYRVSAVSRNLPRDSPNLNLKNFQLDLSLNPSLSEVLNGVETVFHLVASGPPSSSNQDLRGEIERNVLPTIHLLEECVAAGVKKVVFLSSGGTVYGDQPAGAIPEHAEKFPKSAYAISKLTIEYHLRLFRELHGLSYTSLRLSNPYGPHQVASAGQGAVAMFFEKLISGQEIELWGDGSSVRDFIYIDDVVDAMLKVANSSLEGEYNLGSGVGTTIAELINRVSVAASLTPNVRRVASRKIDVSENVLNCEKLRRDLKWAPSTTLQEGLEKTARWWKER